MVFDGDLDQLYSANDPFCVQGVFTISVGVTVSVYGHFIEATEAVNFETGQPEANDASFEVRTSEVAAVKNEMSVVIDSVTYKVKRKQKIGTGTTLIYLKT
jgi:hypothetical protein